MAAVKSSVDIQNDLISSIYENTIEAISGQTLQDRLTDMAVSYINRITDRQFLNLQNFSASRGYEVGEATIVSGIIYECTTAHTGAWNPANFTAITTGLTADSLSAVLAVGNTTGGTNIELSNGDLIQSADTRTQFDLGSGVYASMAYAAASTSNVRRVNATGIEDSFDNSVVASTRVMSAVSIADVHDLLITQTAPVVYQITPTAGNKYATNYLSATTSRHGIVQTGVGGFDSYMDHSAAELLLKHTDQVSVDAPIFQLTTDGGGFGESYVYGDASQVYMARPVGGFGVDASIPLSWTDYINISSGLALIKSSAQITFDAPLYNFAQLTKDTVTYLDVSKNLKSSTVETDGNDFFFSSGYGIDTTLTGGSDVLNIGTTNANVINYGNSTTVHNFLGTAIYELQVNAYVEDKLMTLNYGGAVASGIGVGFEIEENSVITGYFKTNAARSGYSFLAPAIAYKSDYSLASLTADRTHTLPDASGIFMLTDGTLISGAKILVGSDATYDLWYNGGSGAITRLATANTSVLTTNGSGVPSWSAQGTAFNKAFGTSAGTVTEGNDARFGNEASISASAIDWNVTHHYKTLGANTTFTFSNAAAAKTIIVAITNTASNYTVTWPTVKWSGGVAPVQTTGAKTDVYTFTQINGVIYGAVVQNIS